MCNGNQMDNDLRQRYTLDPSINMWMNAMLIRLDEIPISMMNVYHWKMHTHIERSTFLIQAKHVGVKFREY